MRFHLVFLCMSTVRQYCRTTKTFTFWCLLLLANLSNTALLFSITNFNFSMKFFQMKSRLYTFLTWLPGIWHVSQDHFIHRFKHVIKGWFYKAVCCVSQNEIVLRKMSGNVYSLRSWDFKFLSKNSWGILLYVCWRFW